MKSRSPSRLSAWVSALATSALVGTMSITLGGVAVADEAPADPQPLIHYSFAEEADGNVVVDKSGNQHNGTIKGSNASFVDGGLQLPGGQAQSDSAYVEVPAAPLAGKTDLTVSIWLKNETNNGNYAAAAIGNKSTSKGYWLLNPANPSGKVKSVVTGATAAKPSDSPWSTEIGAASTGAAADSVPKTDHMALYTAVIDGATGTFSNYLNGVLINTKDIEVSVADYGPAADLVAYIGRSSYNDPFFRGVVADYAVYDQALTASQVSGLLSEHPNGQALLDEAIATVSVPESADKDFTLATTVVGLPVTWSVVSGNEYLSVDPATGVATVTRPEPGVGDGTVNLRAFVLGEGSDHYRDFSVTIPQLPNAEEKVDQVLDSLAIHNAENMRTNFSVPTTAAYGTTIEWEIVQGSATIESGVREDVRSVKITRPAAGQPAATLRLKATVSSDSTSKTKEFEVTIPAMPESSDKNEAYLWAFFTGEGQGAEKVSLAASKGNDALAWNTLNGGNPVFESDKGTEGLRDPFIIRSHDGDKFYLLATDLKIDGLAGGFTAAQREGSQYIEIWESDDLVNWSDQRHVKVSTDYAGNTWAPEAFWDAEIGKYVVYWASNLYDTPNAKDRTSLTYNRMMYATTEDFVTFSEPQEWVDVDRRGSAGSGTIDASVAKLGDVYYRFIKDEKNMTIRQEKSTNLLAKVTGELPGPDAPADQWSLVKEKVAAGQPNGVAGKTFENGEGPNIFEANEGDVNGYEWFLFIDQPGYHGGPNHYVPFASNDLTDGNSWTSVAEKLKDNLPTNADGGKPRHGTIIPVTRAEYTKVLEKYAPAIAVDSVGGFDPVTTIPGRAPKLPETVSLTFKEGAARDVAVVWDEIPESAYAQPGEFTVTGIAQDDARTPVSLTVTVQEAGTADASLDSLTIAGVPVDITAKTPTVALLSQKAPSADEVEAVTNAPGATAQVTVAGGAVTIVVTAADGTTSQTYTVAILTPTAHYDMSAADGKLTDISGNGRDGTLVGLTEDSFGSSAEGTRYLRFANDGTVSLPQGIVTPADNDFTVEMTVNAPVSGNQFAWVLGTGVGRWNTTELGNHVFMNPNSAQEKYEGQVMAAIRVKDSGNGEVRLPQGGATNPGFSTVTLVSRGNTLTVFVDGVKISEGTHDKSLADIIPAGDVAGHLGLSLYQDDAKFTGVVSDVKFWDDALTPAQVSQTMPSSAVKDELTFDAIAKVAEKTMLGSNVSADEVKGNLNLPATIQRVPVSWQSSNPSVITADGTVTRSATDEKVTITLSAVGQTKEFTVTVLSENRAQEDLNAIKLKKVSTENLPLVAEGPIHGSEITWTSSDPSVVTGTDQSYTEPSVGAADPYRGAGKVTRPSYGSAAKAVTLTATVKGGDEPVSRTFKISVAPKGRTAPDTGYASAYFKSDGRGGEKIWMDATTENDFFTFQKVNGGEPVIDLQVDTKGLRDPYILRSQDGDKYYMIATDLCIGCGTSWGDAQSKGSLKVHVWESVDMVTWTRTNEGVDSGIVVNQPNAGMTWAPEAYWDDELQSYVVFFASRLYGEPEHTTNPGGAHARMFYVITRDFQTFTAPPVEWQNTGFARIDSTVMKIDDFYYRFTKNEEGGAAGILERGKDIFLEKSKVLTAPTTKSDWNADPAKGWQLTDTAMTSPRTGNQGEGPQIVKLNDGDPNNTPDNDGYVFLVDNYSDGGYVPFVTTGSEIASSTQDDRLSQRSSWQPHAKEGLPEKPRHGAFVNAPQAVLDAMHSWTEIAAVESTTTVVKTGANATATVVAADQGDVAGQITFSQGEWSQTVDLTPVPGGNGATATIALPAGLKGQITATYVPFDNLVAPSEGTSAALTPVTPEKPTVERTQCGVAGTVVLPDTPGVSYTKTVDSDDSNKVVVTASPEEGYEFADTVTEWSWVLDITAENCAPDIDWTALDQAIQSAGELNPIDYTAESWAKVSAALAVARETKANQSVTQEQVDSAADSLNSAIEALVIRPGTEATVKRVSGQDRYETAVAVAREAMDNQSVVKGAPVYIATGTSYADAVSIAPVAAKNNGIVLLASRKGLTDSSVAVIKDLQPSSVILVGGDQALPRLVETQLRAVGQTVEARVFGANRYETSAEIISRYFDEVPEVVVATGRDFPDSLSASAMAGTIGAPMLLVDGAESSLSAAASKVLADRKAEAKTSVLVVGGPAAVNDRLYGSLTEGYRPTRLGGADRYETNVAVNQELTARGLDAPGIAHVWVASGADYPDAIVSSAQAGTLDQRFYLAKPKALPESAREAIARSSDTAYIVGGVNALHPSVFNQARDAR